MTPIHELVAWCDQQLNAAGFNDYCPNGLQVEAGEGVALLVSGVDQRLTGGNTADHAANFPPALDLQTIRTIVLKLPRSEQPVTVINQ